MLAYVVRIVGTFWSMLIYAGFVLMHLLIFRCFCDNVARQDHRGRAKFGWTVFILFVPVPGALDDIIARRATT